MRTEAVAMTSAGLATRAFALSSRLVMLAIPALHFVRLVDARQTLDRSALAG
jgi:hypothetical protein